MDKVTKIQKGIKGKLKAALFTDGVNRYYLTGMKSSAGMVLVTEDQAWLFIDFRYLEEAQKKVKNCQVVEEKDGYNQVYQQLNALGLDQLGIVSGQTSLAQWQVIREKMPGISIDTSGVLDEIIADARMRKDEDEIACHRRAQQITDQAFGHILDVLRPGITEVDVARELCYTMEKLGSDDHHYNFIVASGKNSSLPHGFATNKKLEEGDFVTMDFGAVIGGYFADMTRTVALGRISDEQRKVYHIVKEAQKRALDCIHPGAVCNEVDAAARDYIYSCGYEGCFSHGLGHGVGMDVHENPRFNQVCTQKLAPGTVITVEPGIYLRDRFGVRIEDMIVIREDGYENLTKSTKELIVI